MKILIPATLVVALAAGALARSFTTDPAPAPAPAPASPSATGPEVGSAVPETAPPEPAAVESTPVVDAVPGSLDARLARAIDRLPPPELVRESEIEGVAYDDPAGTPVVGVEVTITPIAFEVPGYEDPRVNLQHGDFEKYIVDRVAQHRFRQSATRTTFTDDAGRFAFDDLPFARYRVSAEDPSGTGELRVFVDDSEREFCDPGAAISIRRVQKYRVAFEVRHPDGSSPQSATISVGEEEFAWTPEQRVFPVSGGSHRFKIEEGDVTLASKRAGIYGDRVEFPVVLEFEARGGVYLSVTFPPDEPPKQFRAYSALLPPGVVPDEEWILRHGTEHHLYADSRHVRSGEPEGVMKEQITRLPAGEYVFAIGRTSHTVDQFATVTVPEDELVPLVLALEPVSVESVIEVWVYGPDGQVIKDASLSLRLESGFSGGSVEATTLARPDGSYWLRPEPLVFEVMSGERAGTVTLHVRADNYPAREIPLTTAFVEVQFEPAATLFLDIVGAELPEDLSIQMVSASGANVGSWGLDDLEGGFGSLEAGDFLVSVSSSRGWDSAMLVEPFWLTLVPGENHASVSIPPSYELVVDVPDVKSGQQLMLFRIDGIVFPERYSNPLMAEPEGTTFRFENLLPGRYSMLLGSQMSMDFSGMEVSIPRDSRVSYEGIELTAVMVRVSEFGSEEIPLRDGDKLIGVDGKEFSGIADMAMVFEGNIGTVKFIVIRDGQQIEVETSPSQLQTMMRGGAQLLPVARD